MADLLELGRSECEGLLRLGVLGRVAVATPNGPHILPVNYAVSHGDVVVCTTPYSVLGTYGRDSLLAFEIDHFDHPRHHGWSVVVRGRAVAVEDPDELSALATVLPRPWASGSRSLFLRIQLSEITGRRLGAGWDLEADLPVRRV